MEREQAFDVLHSLPEGYQEHLSESDTKSELNAISGDLSASSVCGQIQIGSGPHANMYGATPTRRHRRAIHPTKQDQK